MKRKFASRRKATSVSVSLTECAGAGMAAAQGQTIADRLNAARHSLAGQGLAKAVCKATTEELLGPKKKHLDCKLTDSWHDSELGLYVFGVAIVGVAVSG